MDNKIKIGEKIRLLRKKNDVTQDKLAYHLGVTPPRPCPAGSRGSVIPI